MNFIDYYVKFKDYPEFKSLFPKFKLIFEPGSGMNPDLWEIAHLYRVLICRKVSKGKKITDFGQAERHRVANGHQLKPSARTSHHGHNRDHGHGREQRNYSQHDRSRDHQSRSYTHDKHQKRYTYDSRKQ